jgi:hypothetical protein
MKRRPLNLNRAEFGEQKKRLTHAFQNADLSIHTEVLTPDEVQNLVVKFLRKLNIQPKK